APVQCTTWGHPITSGIQAIDYFISSETLESDAAEPQYTETLVRLKTLPIHYYRPELPAPLKDKAHFGLSMEDHIYGCPQSLFKFHPDFDEVLASILRADPRGKLLLLQGLNSKWVELLQHRFARTMPDCSNRILFLPPLDVPDFINLLAVCDVLLDPLHFGGGNSSYEGLAVGTPIVTLPSQFLRGRITLALYSQMQGLDCVADHAQDYVQKAVRLGTDADYRASIRQKLLAANEVLFENSAGIRELEHFLQRAVEAAAAGRKASL
ncbi:MAG TPA: hypothetical protein VE988_26770, partial [Gemmataceae bacterium]|nr:hypothetical protein [Gemmataceae bacterium]